MSKNVKQKQRQVSKWHKSIKSRPLGRNQQNNKQTKYFQQMEPPKGVTAPRCPPEAPRAAGWRREAAAPADGLLICAPGWCSLYCIAWRGKLAIANHCVFNSLWVKSRESQTQRFEIASFESLLRGSDCETQKALVLTLPCFLCTGKGQK